MQLDETTLISFWLIRIQSFEFNVIGIILNGRAEAWLRSVLSPQVCIITPPPLSTTATAWISASSCYQLHHSFSTHTALRVSTTVFPWLVRVVCFIATLLKTMSYICFFLSHCDYSPVLIILFERSNPVTQFVVKILTIISYIYLGLLSAVDYCIRIFEYFQLLRRCVLDYHLAHLTVVQQ